MTAPVRTTFRACRKLLATESVEIPEWAQVVKAWAKGGGSEGVEGSAQWDASTLGGSLAVSVAPGGTTTVGALSVAGGGSGDAAGYGYLFFESVVDPRTVDFSDEPSGELKNLEALGGEGLLMYTSLSFEYQSAEGAPWVVMPDGMTMGDPADIAIVEGLFL